MLTSRLNPRLALSGLLILSAALSPCPAYAFHGVHPWAEVGGEITLFPTIEVLSNGKKYTKTTNIAYGWEGKIHIVSPGAPYIKGWKVWPVAKVGPSPPLSENIKSFPSAHVSKRYKGLIVKWANFDKLVKEVEKDVGRLFQSDINSWAVENCNNSADVLRAANGWSDARLFSYDRPLQIYARLTIDPDFTYSPSGALQSAKYIHWKHVSDIVCKKWSGAQIPTAGGLVTETPDFALKSSQLTIFYPPGNTCPATVSLYGKIKSNIQGVIKNVWFEHRDIRGNDWKSKKVQLSTGSANKQGEVETEHNESIEIPLPNSQPVPPDYDVNIDQPDPTFAPGGSGGGGTTPSPSLASESTTPGNLHIGWFRLWASTGKPTIIKPDGSVVSKQKVKSDWKKYNITCEPRVNPQVGGAVDTLSTNVQVLQSSLTVTPKTSLLGKCEVKLNGSVQTNVAHAKVTLGYENQAGVTSPTRVVTTGADKTVIFSDTFDFSSQAGGMWIDQSGAIGLNGGSQAGRHSGTFRIKGTQPAFQSSIASYDFNCQGQAPGGKVAKPKKPKIQIPTMGGIVSQPRPGGSPQTGGGKIQRAGKTETKAKAGVASVQAKKPGKPDAVIQKVERIAPRKFKATIRNKGTANAKGCILKINVVEKNNKKKVLSAKLGVIRPGKSVSTTLANAPRAFTTKKATARVSCPGETRITNNRYTIK